MSRALDLIQNIALELNLISIYDLEAYTVQELLYKIGSKVNEMVSEVNTFEGKTIEAVKEMALELDELLRGDKVETEINKTLLTWKESGVFDSLIQGSVFQDFENRLTSVQEEMPVLKEEVEKTLSETKQQIGSFNEYSFNDYPIFHKTLYGSLSSVMQSFAKFDDGTWLFSQVGATSAPEGVESFTFSRLDNNSEILDTMEVISGGHGLFSAIKKGNTIEVYFADANDRLIKTTYQKNTILDLRGSNGFTVLPKYTDERQLITVDEKNNQLMLLSRNSLKVYYKAEIFNLTDYLAGIQTEPHAVLNDTTPANQTLQGLAIRGNTAVIYHGGVGAKPLLRVYNVRTGKYTDYQYDKLGYSSKHDTASVVEGEGIYFDNDDNLYIGVSTGTPATIRSNHIFVFATVKQSRDFISETLENSQTYKLTEGSGHAMWYEPKPQALSEIVKPGWYYFPASEFNFSDIPSEYLGVSGFWLNVYPRAKDGTVYQELIRNTSGKNQWRLGRQVTANKTASDWVSLQQERKTLWTGDSRTNDVLTLTDAIDKYDFLWVRLWHEGGKYTTELIRTNQIITDKKMHFHGVNLPDSTSSLALYFQELEVAVSDDFRTLTQTRKSRIKLDSDGVLTRNEDSPIGIHEIQGIRGFVAL